MVANALTHPGAGNGPANDQEDGFSIFSASQIGESNKRRLLQTLFDRGPTSRADLARLSDTKRTTISGIVQPLIDGGLLVEEAPSGKRGVGKPARPLWFSPDAAPVCAVNLMPGLIQTAMVSLVGETYGLERVSFDQSGLGRQHYIDALNACISKSLEQARATPLGIGIAVGGMVDPTTGSIVAMNLAPELAGLDLANRLKKSFALTTIIDHHPRAILLGERWFGIGRGLKDFAVIYADEVLGCSLYLNGEPFVGPHGSGGELGHMIVETGGSICTCGKRGCWETIATLPWLRRRAAVLGMPASETLDVEELSVRAETDAAAQTLLEEYAHNLSVGIANLQTLLMPCNYVIFGNAARGSERLLDRIRHHVHALSPAHPSAVIDVRFGRDQEVTTLRGAAGLIIADKLRIAY